MPTPRLQYLIDRYGEKLAVGLPQGQGINLSPEEAVMKFSLSDPTRNKSATQWLITTYLQNGFRFEDLLGDHTSKVHETLLTFGLYRKNLDVSKRSLNEYKTLAGLWFSVERFISKETELVSLEGRALKRAERDRAYGDTFFICENDKGFTVVSPKTEFASCWWGKGTRWCTASDKNNMFNHYNDISPLLILIMPNRDKLQLHIGEAVQFMDARDENVTHEYLSEHWDVLKNIMLYAIKQDGLALYCIPSEYRDRELCWEAVKQNGRALAYVSLKYRDRELCWEAVRKDGSALQYVPKEHLNGELCWEAVKQNGRALAYVPLKYRDKKLCWEAVRKDGVALGHVPQEHQDKEIYLEAVRQNGMALAYAPSAHINRELCWKAVKQNGEALQCVPREYRDKEICWEAVKQNGMALPCVPLKYRDKELCWEVIKQDGWALRDVPREYLDRELCLEAVKQNGLALEYVPKEHINRELCIEAVRLDGRALHYVPEQHRDKEVCLEAVKSQKLKDWAESLLLIKEDLCLTRNTLKDDILLGMKETFSFPSEASSFNC